MIDLEFIFLRYGWPGLAITALLLAMLAVQIYCYAFRYRSIVRYRNNDRQRRTESDTPPVSVVVPLFSENVEFAETGLVRLLAQDYDAYEVVVVYVGMDTDFYDDLARMCQSFPNLHTTKIEMRPHYPISNKMALNIGIKAARNENIIITHPEAAPRTNRWLALMAKGFVRGEIVIGYCGIESRKNLIGGLVSTDRMMQSVEWLAAAVDHRPYRGHRNNFGFTKTLYFKVNGFNHLNMNVGEDDLFMQRIMTRDNVSVVLSPRATMAEKQTDSLRHQLKKRRFYRSTRALYPASVRRRMRVEPVSRLLFFAAAIVGAATMPIEFCAGVVAIVLLRYIIVAITVAKLAERLSERRSISLLYPLYDLFQLPFELVEAAVSIRKDPSVWRYTSIS